MRHVLFPIVHGVQIGRLPDNYADAFIAGVKSYLTPEEREFLVPLPYNWTRKIQMRQMRIFNSVESGLRNRRLRELKHLMASEIVWYNRTKTTNSFFDTIHSDLNNLIASKLTQFQDPHVVFFGHSLGSQMAFNFCWETKLPKISGIFFAGSPFTMYSGMFPDWGRLPKNLSGFLINFYNTMDFISSKIGGAHPSKQIAGLVRDVEISLGWNPFYWFTLDSHAVYWRSRTVWKTVAETLKPLLNEQASAAVPVIRVPVAEELKEVSTLN